jgi:hypothetical protein
MMENFSLKAVLLGVLTDIGGSVVFGGLVGLAAGIVLAISGASIDDVESLELSLWILVPTFVIGLAFTMLGGFVAGRVAKRRQTFHGGVTGLVSALIGLTFAASWPVAFAVLSFVCIPPVAAFGGHLSQRRGDEAV